MTTFTREDRISAQQCALSKHIITAKQLLGEIELLTACPSNTDLVKVMELRDLAIKEIEGIVK